MGIIINAGQRVHSNWHIIYGGDHALVAKLNKNNKSSVLVLNGETRNRSFIPYLLSRLTNK